MTKKDVRRAVVRDEQKEKERFESLKNQIRARLQERGDIDRLRSYLSWKLSESGWKNNMVEELKGVVKEKGGNVTVETMYNRVSARGRRSVDQRVVNDMMRKLRYCTIEAFCNPNDEDRENTENSYDHPVTNGVCENGDYTNHRKN